MYRGDRLVTSHSLGLSLVLSSSHSAGLPFFRPVFLLMLSTADSPQSSPRTFVPQLTNSAAFLLSEVCSHCLHRLQDQASSPLGQAVESASSMCHSAILCSSLTHLPMASASLSFLPEQHRNLSISWPFYLSRPCRCRLNVILHVKYQMLMLWARPPLCSFHFFNFLPVITSVVSPGTQ